MSKKLNGFIKSWSKDFGVIVVNDKTKNEYSFHKENIIDLDRSPNEGDKVLFELRGSAEDKLQHAFNVKIIGSDPDFLKPQKQKYQYYFKDEKDVHMEFFP